MTGRNGSSAAWWSFRLLPRLYLGAGSIRTKMLQVFLLLVLLPASVIIVCSLFLGMHSARQLAIAQLESVAVVKEAEIRSLLKQMHSYLANTVVGPMAYSSAVVLLEGKGGAAAARQASRYGRDRFRAALAVSDVFEELMLVSVAGRVVLSTAPVKVGAYFPQPLLKSGLTGPVARIEEGSLYSVIPVRNRRGATIGVMCGRGSLEKLNQIMLETGGMGETGETYLIDAKGSLVTQSRFTGYRVGIRIDTEGVAQLLGSKSAGSALYRDYRGIPVLGAFRWLPELNVGILAERDQSELFSPIETGAAINLAVAFVALLVAAVASFRYSTAITAPIAELADTATRIAAGDLELKAKVEREDEIGTLAHAFNSMTRQHSELIAKLRSSETKYRIVADKTYGWEFWRSPDGRFLYVSPSCERISGYRPDDFYADPSLILRIVHAEDRAAFDAHQQKALRGDLASVVEMEFRIIAADGSERWIGHVCASVWDDAGNLLGKRGTNRDITEAKKTEAELKEAKEQAEAANRAKSAFISSMSHELRTPLNTIIGYIQILLRDDSLTDTQRSRLTAALVSGKHLLALINDILAVGKIETGSIRLEEKPFCLPFLLSDLLKQIRVKAEEKGLELRLEEPALVPAGVRGDEAKLRQILLNLLDNAVRYTKRGSVLLRVNYSADDGTMRFEVADTGIGIPADKLEAVLQPFTQLAREGQAREGTGLGLPIARHLATLMLGKMEVESALGRGSTFRVEVPLPAVGEELVDLAVQVQQSLALQAAAPAPEQREMEVPPPQKLRELFILALQGDMRSIAAWAGNLMEQERRYSAFATEVCDLAEAFKAKAIVSLVEEHLRRENHER